jgi:hypothetical protein
LRWAASSCRRSPGLPLVLGGEGGVERLAVNVLGMRRQVARDRSGRSSLAQYGIVAVPDGGVAPLHIRDRISRAAPPCYSQANNDETN